MGISLQQWRAAIGNWHARLTWRKLEQSPLQKRSHTDLFTNSCMEENYQKGQLGRLWKIYATLLCGIALYIAFVISQSLNYREVADTTYKSCPINTTKTNNLDLALATGNILSQQCQKLLLIRAGVEQNPGPGAGIDIEDETVNKQEDIIADLCAEAQEAEVRDCLRLYKAKNSIKQHKAELAKCNKPAIIKTLDFLAVPGQDQFNKPACVNTLICRIQNLLPDICKICETEYCVKRDEISLLDCEICGQGSHNECLLNHLGVKPEEQEAFDPAQAGIKLNPTQFPGLHYLCGACEATIIPDKEAGLLKRKSTVITEVEKDSSDSQPENPTEAEDETNPGQPIQSQVSRGLQNQRPQASEEGIQDPNQSQSQPQAQPLAQPQRNTTLCSFYRKGTCRFGASGRGCPNEHPRPCKKLVQHGIKAPNGCTLGRTNCENFHPKMCHTSLTKAICFNTDCKLRHVPGTKREPSDENTGQKTTQKDTRDTGFKQPVNKTNDTVDFLGVLHRLKVDMLEAMDTKIAQYISAQTQAPTTGNYTWTATPRMNMAEPTSYVNHGLQGPLYPMSMQTGQPWSMTTPGQPVYIQGGLNPMAPMFMPFRPGGLSH